MRFNSADSAYLTRTPASSGNRRTWTWSGWVKRTTLSADTDIFGLRVDGNNQFRMFFNTSNGLGIYNQVSGTIAAQIITSSVFRDPSAWYHIVVVFDTNNDTSGDRLRLYINGSRVTALSTDTQPSSGYVGWINSTNSHLLGYFGVATGNYYLTEINFIDGLALTASSFGYLEPNTGVWSPLQYVGSYAKFVWCGYWFGWRGAG
ncbi:hypothetical protein EBZ39_14470 [bacterium]|nr:hypothetical protein [bacterium]